MSQLTLVIGNKNYSSWSLRPWFFMQHFQLPFTEKRVALFTDTFEEELAAYGSDSKVPVLQDSELIVWDSLAIMEYLSENHLQNKGWPADTAARAVARSVSNEMHSSFANVRNELPMNCRKTFSGVHLSAAAQREVERIQSLWQLCREKYGKQGEWLFGEFSIADAMFAPVALRFSGYSIALDETAAKYVYQVLHHPAIQEWIAAGKAETEIIAEDEIEL